MRSSVLVDDAAVISTKMVLGVALCKGFGGATLILKPRCRYRPRGRIMFHVCF